MKTSWLYSILFISTSHSHSLGFNTTSIDTKVDTKIDTKVDTKIDTKVDPKIDPKNEPIAGTSIRKIRESLGRNKEEYSEIEKLTGRIRARDFDSVFKKKGNTIFYRYDRIHFDISWSEFRQIKESYFLPETEMKPVHLNILVARWYLAKYSNLKIIYVQNNHGNEEHIHPLYINTEPPANVIEFDVDTEELDLPIRIGETVEDYARRIRNYYDKHPSDKLSAIIDKEFFDICDGQSGIYSHNQMLSAYTRCGQKLINDIKYRIRFIASTLDLIQFEKRKN